MTQYLVNESFIKASVQSRPPVRVDGRSYADERDLSVTFGPLNGQAEVKLGKTIVRCTVKGEVTPPAPERPNEGRLFFNVEVGQIANPEIYEYGRPTPDTTTLCNYVERVLRGSKAIDPESLCVLGGKSVWSVRVDIHVLCDDGNLPDTCSLSALCGLLNFKHESVSFDGDSATIHSAHSREPVPLSVHHLPISTTFVLFNSSSASSSDGSVSWLVDPSAAEERALGTIISVTVNQHGELCGIHKPGGIPIDPITITECIEFAVNRAKRVTTQVRQLVDRK
jgi:exosome complex component RRP45